MRQALVFTFSFLFLSLAQAQYLDAEISRLNTLYDQVTRGTTAGGLGFKSGTVDRVIAEMRTIHESQRVRLVKPVINGAMNIILGIRPSKEAMSNAKSSMVKYGSSWDRYHEARTKLVKTLRAANNGQFIMRVPRANRYTSAQLQLLKLARENYKKPVAFSNKLSAKTLGGLRLQHSQSQSLRSQGSGALGYPVPKAGAGR